MAEPNDTSDAIQLSTNDIVGAVKQMHWELGAYMNQPVYQIDPEIVMGCLERMAQFTSRIPRLPQAQNGAKAEAEHRAN